MSKLHDSASESVARASGPVAPVAGGAEADPLSDVLRTVRLTSALFFLWDASWPFATPVPSGRVFAPIIMPGAQQIISYHIVRQGSCWGGLVGGTPVRLDEGDILLVPRGDPYVISSSERTCVEAALDSEPALTFFRQMAAGELPFVVAEGGGSETCSHLICGFLGCDLRPFNPVLAALPALVHVRRPTGPADDRLQSLIEHTLAEAQQPRPGSQCVLVRLSELMFVEIVRRCLTEPATAGNGWLAGLRDPVVGRALSLLHRQWAASWTLDSLAAEVGVSRSTLAESFSRLVGQPPIEYLTRWRLQMAARMLADRSAKVAAVAHDVGYESEAAFSRAFKRFTGVAPTQWRREAG